MLRSFRRLSMGALAGACLVVLGASVALRAQIAGRNVNMVSGTEWPGGDPFLQRQNEPSIAASTRNPLHLVAGSNDYRSVDVPGLPDGAETGDAWISVYKSFDGGQRWSSTLMPGYPQDTSAAGLASPIKGYQAGADPVVRAGTHGLLYYNGLVFNRGDNGRSAIFLARFIDRNNKENGDPIAYLGTSIVASSDGSTFLDKPWMAVDLPRGNGAFCRVGVDPAAVGDDDDDDDHHGHGGKVKRNGHRNRGRGDDRRRKNQPPDDGYQYVPAGAVYVAYTSITGDGPTLASQIFVKRSMDCGLTWSAPMRVTSTADRINQGATLAVSPTTGDLFVAWRRFSTSTAPNTDAVMVARLRTNGSAFDAPGRAWGMRGTGPSDDVVEKIFEHRKRRAHPTAAATVAQIDQSTSPFRFRTNAYPAMAIDGAGRAYIAWSERGYATQRPDPLTGDARIRVATTLDGRTFSPPVVVDDDPQRAGHQLMPSLAFSKGRLLVVFYDLRETRAQAFGTYVDDQTTSTGLRQTIDIRAALGAPGATPAFAPSSRISDYLMGYRNSTAVLEQLQVNPPNLPMFRLGTVPFIGDYIDVAAAPAFVPTANGEWAYDTAAGNDMPVFHAAWTDNRDVRPPLDGNWANYTPPTLQGQAPGASLFDPTQQVAVCRAGNAGSRNQNIYTARIGGGLLVGSPGNTKTLSSTVQRGFVVFAQNQTTTTRTFRMRVVAQPPQGRASFEQFPLPPYSATSPAPLTSIDVRVPAKSTASRTLYITAPDPDAMVEVAVNEVAAVGGAIVSGGLAGRVVLNPDIENPDIENPDIENPDIENPDIENAEVYNPDIENPDIENPDIENPDIENPDIENPDIENVRVANPDIENPNVANPDIENPDIENPDIENPDIENPDIENGTISDVTWTVSNTGNTTSAFNVNLLLANTQQPSGLRTQLIVYKVYKTPVLDPNGCDLRTETRNLLLFNKPNPNFITPGEGLPDQNDPSDSNATLWLAPGEVGRVTLRVYDDDTSNNLIVTNLDGSTASIDPAFNPKTVVTAGISGQGVDVLDPPGATEPPVVTTTGTNLTFLQQPVSALPGAAIAPAVRVRVWDNTGAVLPGVAVTMTLQNAPGATLSGNIAVTDTLGVATFPLLAVDVPVTGAVLRAAATSPGVVAAGDSAPFNVGSIVASVSLGNLSAIFDGTPKSASATTVPLGLAVGFTYSGSPTPPSAYGAYDVAGTVTTPGYSGTAFGVMTVASTLRGGGNGGGAFGPLSCTPGVVANGVRVHSLQTYALTRAQLLCTDNEHPLPFGGTTPPDLDVLCPAGQVMVGVAGTDDGGATFGNPVVTSIGPRCQLPTGGAIATIAPAPGGGTPFGPLDCPAGQAVTGVVGGQGAVVDSLALVCGAMPPAGPVTAFTETVITGDTSIQNAGVLVAAENLGAGAAVTINGVPFGTDQTGPTLGNWLTGTGDFSVDAFSPALDTVLSGNQYTTDFTSSFTIGGLTPGETYRLQLLFSNDLNGTANDIGVTIQGTTWLLNAWQPNAINLTAEFTAAGAAVVVGFAPGSYPLEAEASRALLSGYALHRTSSLPPTITSAAPATLAAFQYVTILGNDLPATSMSEVLFSQGGPEFAADYAWATGPSMVIARVPTGVLTNGPATVRLKNPSDTVTTNAFPVTISSTPGAPVLLTVYNGSGLPTTTLNMGQGFMVEADGTGSAGTNFHWTQGATTVTQSASSTTGGPTGRVGTNGTVPPGVTPGLWTLTVTSYTSALSNAIVITVP